MRILYIVHICIIYNSTCVLKPSTHNMYFILQILMLGMYIGIYVWVGHKHQHQHQHQHQHVTATHTYKRQWCCAWYSVVRWSSLPPMHQPILFSLSRLCVVYCICSSPTHTWGTLCLCLCVYSQYYAIYQCNCAHTHATKSLLSSIMWNSYVFLFYFVY